MKDYIVKETLPFSIGSAGIALPWWVEPLASGWQFMITVVGGLVVLMTFYKLALEITLRRRDLKK